MNDAPALQSFLLALGQLMQQHMLQQSHIQIVISIKNGAIMPLGINQTVLPAELMKKVSRGI